MITRLWRGWTTIDNADAYERFLLDDLFPSMREIPGFRCADVLRRVELARTALAPAARIRTAAILAKRVPRRARLTALELVRPRRLVNQHEDARSRR